MEGSGQGLDRPCGEPGRFLDLHTFLCPVVLKGNESWQKTLKEYKLALCSRILRHTPKRGLVLEGPGLAFLLSPLLKRDALPQGREDCIVLSYSAQSQTDEEMGLGTPPTRPPPNLSIVIAY